MSEFLVDTTHAIGSLMRETDDTRYGKTVVIKSPDNKNFFGILVDDSVIIPLRVGAPAEDSIQNLANINVMELAPDAKGNMAEVLAHKLGLPYNGQTERLYSDGQVFKGVLALHLYFYEHAETQESFFEKMSEILGNKGVKVSFLTGAK